MDDMNSRLDEAIARVKASDLPVSEKTKLIASYEKGRPFDVARVVGTMAESLASAERAATAKAEELARLQKKPYAMAGLNVPPEAPLATKGLTPAQQAIMPVLAGPFDNFENREAEARANLETWKQHEAQNAHILRESRIQNEIKLIGMAKTATEKRWALTRLSPEARERLEGHSPPVLPSDNA